jgi:hypothetical protein
MTACRRSANPSGVPHPAGSCSKHLPTASVISARSRSTLPAARHSATPCSTPGPLICAPHPSAAPSSLPPPESPQSLGHPRSTTREGLTHGGALVAATLQHRGHVVLTVPAVDAPDLHTC